MSSKLHNHEIERKEFEKVVYSIKDLLKGNYNISKKTIAKLLLMNDLDILSFVTDKEPKDTLKKIQILINEFNKTSSKPSNLIYKSEIQRKSREILDGVIENDSSSNYSLSFIDKMTMHPFWGFIVLAIVIYLGLYQLVGGFGAGVLVNLIEKGFFEVYINPTVNYLAHTYIPWSQLQDLVANQYGIITMGVKYAVAIVLPIVTVFFFVFSIIEDSGYLPRLAMLIDFIFKKIGLSGRAVIPMALGFGCDTMATMVTRTLETKRERIIATFLLALAIPCSAQLGVVFGILSSNIVALSIWISFVLIIFLLIGFLTAKLMPGEAPSFYMELPPLRLPKIKNVFLKTYTRMYWYFLEIFPMFIWASIIIWVANITGLFTLALTLLNPVVYALNLPPKLSEVFLYGFFRRDYGSASLYDLHQQGVLNINQLVVAASTLTLFVPCIAQFMMMIKERGWKTAVGMSAFIFPFAFIAGFILNKILIFFGVNL